MSAAMSLASYSADLMTLATSRSVLASCALAPARVMREAASPAEVEVRSQYMPHIHLVQSELTYDLCHSEKPLCPALGSTSEIQISCAARCGW